jgi:hypothetical protein
MRFHLLQSKRNKKNPSRASVAGSWTSYFHHQALNPRRKKKSSLQRKRLYHLYRNLVPIATVNSKIIKLSFVESVVLEEILLSE